MDKIRPEKTQKRFKHAIQIGASKVARFRNASDGEPEVPSTDSALSGARRKRVGGRQGQGEAPQKSNSIDLAHLRKDLYPLDGAYGRGLLQIPSDARRVLSTGPPKQRKRTRWGCYSSSKRNSAGELAECLIGTPRWTFLG